MSAANPGGPHASGRQLAERLDIGAGREGPVTGAGHDHGAHVFGVVDDGQVRFQLLDHGNGERIQLVRS
ncbi:hypothetical protein SDC9_142664 [bioreactor metagenome]|uniref:Uncharacterized protein n=1 Tax=bioreactor metagenome TaxID=1076179 RepID=A0A645E171_9ZZZZ